MDTIKASEILVCNMRDDGVLLVTAYKHNDEVVAADRFSFEYEGRREESAFERRGFKDEKELEAFARASIIPSLAKKFPAEFPMGRDTKILADFCPMTLGSEAINAQNYAEMKL